MKKKLLIVVGGLLVLVVVGVAIVFFSIDTIAKRAIERGATQALGVKTTVSSVSVGLLSGEFSLKKLEVANPDKGGFKANHFLTLGSGGVAVTLSTLRKPTVEMPRLGL